MRQRRSLGRGRDSGRDRDRDRGRDRGSGRYRDSGRGSGRGRGRCWSKSSGMGRGYGMARGGVGDSIGGEVRRRAGILRQGEGGKGRCTGDMEVLGYMWVVGWVLKHGSCMEVLVTLKVL